MTPVSILRNAVLGALGGAVNAGLCYAKIPVPVEDNPTFKWHVIPAGALHGGILVLVPLLAFRLLLKQGLRWRILVAPLVGWVAGYLSWIPLHRSVFDEGWPKALSWPFQDGASPGGVLFAPFTWFGFVALGYFLGLVFLGGRNPGLRNCLLVATASGVLGSLWWWISWKPWYFSILHGSVWGVAVGFGTWVGLGLRRPSVATEGLQGEAT